MVAEVDASAYAPLPGRGRRLSGRFLSGEAQRLFVSSDHLLVLRRLGYEETAKRFSLKDIQAITLQSNGDRAILSAILMGVMMAFAVVGLIAISQEVSPGYPGMYFVYGPMLLCLFFLALNLVLGPTCTVRLHTAVQIEDLSALRRQRAARKCLGLLVPRIEAAQGSRLALEGAPMRASANLRIARGAKKQTTNAVGRGLHATAFSLTLLLGVSLIVELVYESAAKDIVDLFLIAASTVLLFVAAIRQTNSTLPSQTRMFTWAIFLVNGMGFMFVMYVVTFMSAFEAVAARENPPMFQSIFVPGQEDPRWFDAMVAVWGLIGIGLALFGLMSIRGYSVVERQASGGDGTAAP